MPWVSFSAPFDFKPKPSMTIAFKAGETKLVTSACATKAIAAGKAVRVRKPKAAGDA